jgi:superfamily II DNA or RNA helicase
LADAPLFSLQQLHACLPPDLREKAANCLTPQAIRAFRLDARGRIEAGISPVGSPEPASYCRLTVRGLTLQPQCDRHGKAWCLHTAILALHHLGYRPTPPAAKPPPAPNPQPVALGYALVFECSAKGAEWRVLARSTQQFVRGLPAFLARHTAALALPPQAAAALEALEDGGDHLMIEPDRVAEFLNAFWRCPLLRRDGSPWHWASHPRSLEPLQVRLTDSIQLRIPSFAPMPTPQVVFPGCPGFALQENTLIRLPGAMADLNPFLAQCGSQLNLPLNAQTLYQLASCRQGIQWLSPRPLLIQDPEALALELRPAQTELEGAIVLSTPDGPVDIPDLSPLQWLQPRPDQPPFLLRLHPAMKSRLESIKQALRAPWLGNRFRLPGHQAQTFLHSCRALPFPVTAQKADSFFGGTRLVCSIEWQESGPLYTLDGMNFSHQQLQPYLLDDLSGATLPDGRILRFDAELVALNEDLLRSASHWNRDPEQRQAWLRRLQAPLDLPDAPSDLPEILRPYQRQGVAWLLERFEAGEAALLADEMGLGKTVQTLHFLARLPQPGPILVVVPASLLSNWQREAHQHSPKLHVLIYHGSSRQTQDLGSADLVLTTYGILLKESASLQALPWQAVVLDEAQAIKNHLSKIHQATLAFKPGFRLALSGTPMENHPGELAAIFHFLLPGLTRSPQSYRRVQSTRQWEFQALTTLTRPFILRRTKAKVEPQLPPRSEEIILLDMSEEQTALHQSLLLGARQELEHPGRPANALGILTRLLRLRQVACHPGLYDEGRLAGRPPKFQFLLERLQEIAESGAAALVFSQFTRLLRLLAEDLARQDIAHLYLDGSTQNRQELVDDFQSGKGHAFLISLKAGGTGLNLTRASYVFLLDPWWNPMAESQAFDRAHRIGQSQKVFCYRLVSAASIEERVLALQNDKRALTTGLWSESGWKPSQAELQALLSL